MSYVVYLSDKRDEARTRLAAFAKTNRLSALDMTLNASGSKSPRGYKLNPAVEHTILMYSGNKVVENFALNKLDAESTKKVLAAARKLLESKPDKQPGKKPGKKGRRSRKQDTPSSS